MKQNKWQIENGFTLIELLISVAILSVLAIVVLVGLKPVQRMADSRDARRAQDINQLLTGIHECSIDKKDSSSLSTCLGTTVIDQTYEIVTTGISSSCTATCTNAASGSSCLPLDVKLTDYFTSLPTDPIAQTTGHTGYSITRKTNGMVILEACAAENGPIIVSR